MWRLFGSCKKSILIDQYPIPKTEELFNMPANGKQFSVIDLGSAYLQMNLKDEHRHLLTINRHMRLFRVHGFPFGFASAPTLWQITIDKLLQRISHTKCYLDDIIVIGMTLEKHRNNLSSILRRLEEFGLKINSKNANSLKIK